MYLFEKSLLTKFVPTDSLIHYFLYFLVIFKLLVYQVASCKFNRPFSYSQKESQSNDTLLHFVEFSNVHNSDSSLMPLDRTSRIKMYNYNA